MEDRTKIDNIDKLGQFIKPIPNEGIYWLELINCEIILEISLYDIVNHFNKSITKCHFWNCIFKENVEIQLCDFNSDAKTIFEKEVRIMSSYFSDEENVTMRIGGNFRNKLTVDNIHFRLLHINAKINKELQITNCTIQNFTYVTDKENKRIFFENCWFKCYIDFSKRQFNEIGIYDSKFDEAVNFYNAVFKGDAEFIAVHLNTDLYFQGAIFEKKLILNNITIPNILSLNSATIEWIRIENVYFSGQPLNMANIIVKKVADKETARFLKHEAIKRHDNIASIEFNVKEMNKYWIEVRGKEKCELDKNGEKREKCRCSEFILLTLNLLSNKYGKSWTRGILFTFTVWILFFGIFVMIRDGIGGTFIFCIPELRKEAIEYFWLPNGIEGLFSKGINVCWSAILFFFLGKIFIAYGIFQTISAFRKYGKI